MKLSTRIKRYVYPTLIYGDLEKWGDETARQIVLMVDWGSRGVYKTYSFAEADNLHKRLLSEGRTLLPLTECPVVNSKNQIIMHYKSNVKEN